MKGTLMERTIETSKVVETFDHLLRLAKERNLDAIIHVALITAKKDLTGVATDD